ncbi:MAG: gamma-glutamylcyclotransferase [Acidimicrobiia bacterium]|nr:gamma-glutamylcyclotransferase [Acidimicrobiia bacterium]NNF70221.1 gamma-glutamylcyclotransferase [Acidimicrobiia bacterium]NNK92422.1 gamma-glutamylcyclotransferase [Acidimicrobiia bacterium]
MLYFAYTALITPERLAQVAPTAEFKFIAHLPEWGLEFPINDDDWGGGLPSVSPTTGSTVWGAVFEVPEGEVDLVKKMEGEEHRAATTIEAMDRTGKRHQVTTFVFDGKKNGGYTPSSKYLLMMLRGSRHWSLPAGWIAGLEEHLSAAS